MSNELSINPHLKSLSEPVPGRAILLIKNWTGDTHDLAFSIQSNQGQQYLQEEGSWGNAPCWFSCNFQIDEKSGDLNAYVGREIVDAVLGEANVSYRLSLRQSDGRTAGRPLTIDKNLQSSIALGEDGGEPGTKTIIKSGGSDDIKSSGFRGGEGTDPRSGPGQALDKLSSSEGGSSNPGTDPKGPQKSGGKKTTSWIILIVVLVVLLATVAAWWFLHNDSVMPGPAVTPEVFSKPPVAAPVSIAPCSVEAMNAEGELAFVQRCIGQAPDSEELLKVIAAAKLAGKCGVAQRLYANRAQLGDLQIAEAYAREYDPQLHQSSTCFPEPEAATAIYWWETILSFDTNHHLAKQRLEDLNR